MMSLLLLPAAADVAGAETKGYYKVFVPALCANLILAVRIANVTRSFISIGLAWIADGVDTLQALVSRADAARYRAKHRGRNRVVTMDDTQSAEVVGMTQATTTAVLR